MRYPRAGWTASKDGIAAVADLFSDLKLKLPRTYGSVLANPLTSLPALKFADVLLLASDWGVIIIGSLGLNNKQRDTFCNLFTTIGAMMHKRITIAELNKMDEDISKTLSDAEKDLPRFTHTYALHALSHQVDQIRRFGPHFAHGTLYGERMIRHLLRLTPESRRGVDVMANKYEAWMNRLNISSATTKEGHIRNSFLSASCEMGINVDDEEKGLNSEPEHHYYSGIIHYSAPPSDEEMRLGDFDVRHIGSWRLKVNDVEHCRDTVTRTFEELCKRRNNIRRRGIVRPLLPSHRNLEYKVTAGNAMCIESRAYFRTAAREASQTRHYGASGKRGRSWCRVFVYLKTKREFTRYNILSGSARQDTDYALAVGKIVHMFMAHTTNMEGTQLQAHFMVVDLQLVISQRFHRSRFLAARHIPIVDDGYLRGRLTNPKRVTVSLEDISTEPPFLVPVSHMYKTLLEDNEEAKFSWRAVVCFNKAGLFRIGDNRRA